MESDCASVIPNERNFILNPIRAEFARLKNQSVRAVRSEDVEDQPMIRQVPG